MGRPKKETPTVRRMKDWKDVLQNISKYKKYLKTEWDYTKGIKILKLDDKILLKRTLRNHCRSNFDEKGKLKKRRKLTARKRGRIKKKLIGEIYVKENEDIEANVIDKEITTESSTTITVPVLATATPSTAIKTLSPVGFPAKFSAVSADKKEVANTTAMKIIIENNDNH